MDDSRVAEFHCHRDCQALSRQHKWENTGHAGSVWRVRMDIWERWQVHMTFNVGETVVYPHHGAAKIEAIEQRTIKGETRTYLRLKVTQGDLTVLVPADNAEFVGVRDVVGQEGLDRVFDVLRAPHTEEPTNWWRRDKDRGLSAGEKRMLAKARQILVSELALAEGTNEDKAELVLDEVLAEA